MAHPKVDSHDQDTSHLHSAAVFLQGTSHGSWFLCQEGAAARTEGQREVGDTVEPLQVPTAAWG